MMRPWIDYHIPALATLVSMLWWRHRRDPLSLGLTIGTAPGFTFLYALVYGDSGEPPLEAFVPSLVIFAVIMLIFSTAMSVARELEQGTLDRLQLTKMRPSHYLWATAIFQVLIGTVAVALTFAVAMILPFEPAGSVLLAVAIALGCAASCIGLGIWVGSLADSVQQAFVLASVLMFLLLLFSGLIFPLPQSQWFDVLGHPVGWIDILPTVHGVEALMKVLLEGATASEVAGPAGWMLALSMLFFAFGAWSFSRRRSHRPS